KARVATLVASGTSNVSAVGLSRDGRFAAVSYRRDPKELVNAMVSADMFSGMGFPAQMPPQPPAKGKGKGAAPGMPDVSAIQKMQEQMLGAITGQGGDPLAKQIKIFETATGKEVSTLAGPSFSFASASNLQFSPDGTQLAVNYFFMPDPLIFDVPT